MHALIVVGAGAAGFFAAIIAKAFAPASRVLLLEKTAVPLAKVRISGGGRCNVTHSCFDPILLCQNYPRGHKELRGAFTRFSPTETIAWFEAEGVPLKREEDGRIFPLSNSSQTIIDCLRNKAEQLGVELRLKTHLENVIRQREDFDLFLRGGEQLQTKKLLLATGSSQEGYQWASSLGHLIEEPVPSLFTFNVPSSHLLTLSGIALEKVTLSLSGTSFKQTGPLLLTHFGFSGPAALKLSAWGARYLHEQHYRVPLEINWVPDKKSTELLESLIYWQKRAPHRSLSAINPFHLPKNLWNALLASVEKPLGQSSHRELHAVAEKLHRDLYQVCGKTTHKEEFVTCGGVSLKEVDFRTMESKICPGLYFAGEILDIDGVTGGFNFQNAWTTGFIAGRSITTPNA